MTRQARWVRAFVVHGRIQDQVINYVDFFDWLVQLPQRLTRVQLRPDLVIAINRAVVEGHTIRFRFASGDPSEIPLLYDEQTGEMLVAATPDGTWLASATHVVVLPTERIVIIEGRRVGVGSTNLERYFSKLARDTGFGRVIFDISPLASPSFEAELDRFERIREAVIEVGRPNSDWDDANDILSELAADSGGHKANISVSAARGESLERGTGIVQIIRSHARRALANIRNVKVTGRQGDDTAESTLTLENHQLKQTVDVETRIARELEDEIIFAAELELADRARAVIVEREQARQQVPSSDVSQSSESDQ